MEEGKYKSVTFSSCPEFRRGGVPESTRITGLKQPHTNEETKSIKVYIRDELDHVIVQKEESLTFFANFGTIEHVETSHSPTTVSALSYFTFEIKPAHSLIETEDPMVKVIFPKELEVQGVCDKPTKCEIALYDNSISMRGLVSGTLEGGQSLKFTAGPVKLYQATKVLLEQFKFTTFMKGRQSENYFEVDEGYAKPPIEMTSGDFQKATVSTSSDQSFVKSSLKITMTPDHQVPQYGYFLIVYPE